MTAADIIYTSKGLITHWPHARAVTIHGMPHALRITPRVVLSKKNPGHPDIVLHGPRRVVYVRVTTESRMHFCHQELFAILLALDPTNWVYARYQLNKLAQKLSIMFP